MKISEEALYTALNEFIDFEIMPLAASMDLPKQFLFGLKIGVVKYGIQNVVKTYLNKPEMQTLGIVDENGNIVVDHIYQAARDTLAKVQKLELGGITFKERDLQALYSTVQRYAH